MEEQLQSILDALKELVNDTTVPKNVKSKLETVMSTLNEDAEDLSMRINKALSELDEVSDDTNLQSYTRTQIWNIASMLEMFS
jgi:uncharacterized protein (UPF0147 family)